VILYLDTSALVKLYVEEPGSRAVVAAVEEAAGVATVRVLRGYDAIQLGAALELRLAGRDVTFACSEGRLARAARRERLRVAGTRAETGRSTARFH